MRLKSICTDEIIHQISIHAPLTGCDDTQLKEVTNTADISIHAPLTGCDKPTGDVKPRTLHISIHAPLTGCDFTNLNQFYSSKISIHAPLTGCDLGLLSLLFAYGIFQSTHPLRDATILPF